MDARFRRGIVTLFIIAIGCTLLGLGTSGWVGWGTFFLMWGIGGLLEFELGR